VFLHQSDDHLVYPACHVDNGDGVAGILAFGAVVAAAVAAGSHSSMTAISIGVSHVFGRAQLSEATSAIQSACCWT
jgi:hypothetical protein